MRGAISDAPLPSLNDGPHVQALFDLLVDTNITSYLGDASRHCYDEVISGLWLLAGDIDRSHTISQDIPSADGSFLHGIMHRREGDYGNAKYWFRRVGKHPVLEQIANEPGKSLGMDSIYADPFDFVDACSEAVRSGDRQSECISAQWVEWQCLMAHILTG